MHCILSIGFSGGITCGSDTSSAPDPLPVFPMSPKNHPCRSFAGAPGPGSFSAPGRGGFTLVELLAVIAIIGVLAAIIIPVTGKVRQNARSARDLSNLRQLALALNQLANEARDGRYPRVQKSPEADGWHVEVAARIYTAENSAPWDRVFTRDSVFQAPGRPWKDFPSQTDNWKNGYSYGINSFYANINWGRRLSAVPTPSRIILVGDKLPKIEANDVDHIGTSDNLQQDPNNGTAAPGPSWSRLEYRHAGGSKAHMAFCDGHIESLTAEALRLDPPGGGSRYRWWE